MLASGGGLHGNRSRASRCEANTTKANTSRNRADPNRGYPRVTGAMGDSEGVLMKAGEWQHQFTLNGYCTLCGAFNEQEECDPDTIPDYEAGRH